MVWFVPHLKVSYRPRPNVSRLAAQFHGSGLWRWQIIRTYPDTVSLRYLAAPLATAAVGAAGVVLLVDLVAVHSAALAVAAVAVPAAYLGVVLAGAVATRRGLDARASAYYPVALVTMHMSWGAGFLAGAAADGLRRLRPGRARAAGIARAGR